MKMGKALAVSAVTGILMGSLVGCGDKGAPPPSDPAATTGGKSSCGGQAPAAGTAAPAGGEKASCQAKGSCKGEAPKAQ